MSIKFRITIYISLISLLLSNLGFVIKSHQCLCESHLPVRNEDVSCCEAADNSPEIICNETSGNLVLLDDSDCPGFCAEMCFTETSLKKLEIDQQLAGELKFQNSLIIVSYINTENSGNKSFPSFIKLFLSRESPPDPYGRELIIKLNESKIPDLPVS